MTTKRILILLLALLIVSLAPGGFLLACEEEAANVSAGVGTAQFSDVPPDHWAFEEIMTLHERGVISGYSDGTFKPRNTVSRAEFAKMMVLAMDLPLRTPSGATFNDVPGSHWAYRFVETSRAYLTGFRTASGDYFKPSNVAVREDMAVALVKALGYSGDVWWTKRFSTHSPIAPRYRLTCGSTSPLPSRGV
ncbi:MAG: S-layer homology domain-containing protein [Ignavibacteriales bacterium]